MKSTTLGALLIITSSFFYASYGVWTVLMGDFFGGYTASGLRSLVVLGILLLVALWFRGYEPLAWRQNWRRLLGMVLVSMLVWGPLYWAVLEVGIGMALSINYSAIVIGFLFFGWLLSEESLTSTKIMAASLGILGLALVFVPSALGAIAFLPLLAALISGLAISVNTIWAKQLTYNTTQSTIFLWVTSVLANIPLAFILQEPMPVFELRAEWLYLLLFGVASVLSSWLLLQGMKYVEAGLAGILGLLEIVFGVAFGMLLFNERLEPIALLGIGLILIAAALPYFWQKTANEAEMLN